MSLISQYPSKTFWCVNYAITVFGKILQTRKWGVGAWVGVGQQGGKVFAHTPLYERGLKRCWRRGRGEETTIWGMNWGCKPPTIPKGRKPPTPSPRGATTPPQFLRGATLPNPLRGATTSPPHHPPCLKGEVCMQGIQASPLFFVKNFMQNDQR